jgi:hypothetical protein
MEINAFDESRQIMNSSMKVESRHAWRTLLDLWFGRAEVTYIEWENKSDVSEEAFCYVIKATANL